jgi:hypothetical protein
MNAILKAILNISVLTCLLLAASNPCFALTEIMHVSKERAKALGMEIRSKASGPNAVWVELEFKTEGELKRFNRENNSRVELEIRDGEKLLVGYAALREERPSPGRVVVRFAADRAYLDKITLTVVVGSGQLSGGAYGLRLKDFVDLELRPRAEAAAPDASRRPAPLPQSKSSPGSS